jgi:hypothetical protein
MSVSMKNAFVLKFRETMWFKKGELDAEEAQRAARNDDDLAPGAADLLSPEDRYLDDGTVSQRDSVSYGVRTGTTMSLAQVTVRAPAVAFSEDDMVREMRRRSRACRLLLAAGLLALGGLVLTL